MTCIVGLVETEGDHAGAVLLAGDSAGVVPGEEIYSLRNHKVFRTGSYLIGYTTSFRLGQIIRFGAQLPEPPPPRTPRIPTPPSKPSWRPTSSVP